MSICRLSALLLLAVVITVMPLLPGVNLSAQQAPRDARTQGTYSVNSLADLAPSSATDRALANHFVDNAWPKLTPLVPGGRPQPEDDERGTVRSGRTESKEELLRRRVCLGDAVAWGRVSGRRVIMNAGQNRLISIFEIDVSRWIRPASGERQIVVARTGGRVSVGDQLYESPPVVAPDANLPNLMFVRRITGINAFELLDTMPGADKGPWSFFGTSGTVDQLLETLQKAGHDCGVGASR